MVRQTVADRVHTHHAVALGIQCPARPDEEIQAVMVAGEGDRDQDRVVAPLVELAVGDVGQRKVTDHLSALEPQVAQRCTLVRCVDHAGAEGRVGHGFWSGWPEG